MARPKTDPVARWWSKVDVRGPDECWPWTGGTFHYGHGRFWIDGKELPAHRYGYSILVGPPGDLFVCHSCDNPPCCNQRHWFLGTALDNMRDKVAKGRHYAPGPTNPARGTQNGRAVMNDQTATELRTLAPTMTQTALAQRFGIGRTQVRRILNGESWT